MNTHRDSEIPVSSGMRLSCESQVNGGGIANRISAPQVGLVVGTFGAVPYVHLHLEMRRRHYPDVPMLVSDDGSPFGPAIDELCRQYGAAFVNGPRRLRRTVGDLSAFVRGFDWAQELGLSILVKMSRRFIPLHNWVPGLQKLACQSQMPTFSQCCEHFGFGFRTECIALHCPSWRDSGAVEMIRQRVEKNERAFVEGFIHQLARKVAAGACPAAQEYMKHNPRPADRDCYAPWPLMPDRRTTRSPYHLWHDCESIVDYCRVACLAGLDYKVADFEDPNQGCGLGEP